MESQFDKKFGRHLMSNAVKEDLIKRSCLECNLNQKKSHFH